MKILVPIKRVLDYAAKIKVKADASGIEAAGIKWIVNPFDEIAVEEAIRLKEKGIASEVIVASCGVADVSQQLRYALAMGADRAILIKHDAELDSDLAARVFAEIFKKDTYGMVLMGKQAIDSDSGQTCQILAALLDLPQASFASKIEIINNEALVTREVDGGLEKLKVSLPAVISSDLRLNEPRYASLPGIMQAKKKPLEEIEIASLGIDLKTKITIKKMYPPSVRQSGRKVESVNELVRLLKDEAKVL